MSRAQKMLAFAAVPFITAGNLMAQTVTSTWRDDISLDKVAGGVITDNKLLIIGGIAIIAFLMITARVRRGMTQGAGKTAA
jgi:hypothetical protein